MGSVAPPLLEPDACRQRLNAACHRLLPFCSHKTPKQGETGRSTTHQQRTWNCPLPNVFPGDQRVTGHGRFVLIIQRSLVQIQPRNHEKRPNSAAGGRCRRDALPAAGRGGSARLVRPEPPGGGRGHRALREPHPQGSPSHCGRGRITSSSERSAAAQAERREQAQTPRPAPATMEDEGSTCYRPIVRALTALPAVAK
jgi:hypothetical protein